MIKFWHTTGKYGPFSNFALFGLMVDEKHWPTAEHYYQSQKTQNSELQEQIRKAASPKKAKQMAREVALRPDWEDIKYSVMLDALRAKFGQSASLKQLLLETGDEVLIEDSPYDYIWGCGADGSGQNLLGKALMEIREEFRNSEQD
jgi:hypothetical protein